MTSSSFQAATGDICNMQHLNGGMCNDIVMPETFYTPDEVAGILKISRRTVDEMLRSGRLKGVKAGKYWRIPESALTSMGCGCND